MRVGSLFTGIGGFDLGLERAGIEPAWQVEIDRHAQSVLRRHWPNVQLYTDINEVGIANLEEVDVICGGFPCQDLSVAGGRAGLGGDRSGLFFEFVRILAELEPQWVIIENVPGLLSSNDGRDMGIVLGTLAELGYGFAYRVLNARFFGVPQRRRRVFIVGHLGDWQRAADVLFESEGGGGDFEARRSERAETAYAITSRSTRISHEDNYVVGIRGNATHALTSEGGDASEDGTGRGTPIIAFAHSQGLDIQPSTRATPTLRVGATGAAVAFAENSRAEVRLENGDGQIVGAPKTGGGKPGQSYPAIMAGAIVRRLTPRECERLQGFPDNWTAGQSDAQRYRQLGNAVAVPVVEWIGRRLAMEVA